MRKHELQYKPSSKAWVLFLVSLLLFLYFIPREVMYSDYKFVGWGIYLLIFFLTPFLVYKLINSMCFMSPWAIGAAALSVLIVGPTFGLFQGYREYIELNRNGVWTNSIIIDKKHIKPLKGEGYWAIKCAYIASNKNFETNYKDDIYNAYSIGDTIDIIYSREFPKIYEVGYLYGK